MKLHFGVTSRGCGSDNELDVLAILCRQHARESVIDSTYYCICDGHWTAVFIKFMEIEAVYNNELVVKVRNRQLAKWPKKSLHKM